jgi:hypothetical protein
MCVEELRTSMEHRSDKYVLPLLPYVLPLRIIAQDYYLILTERLY